MESTCHVTKRTFEITLHLVLLGTVGDNFRRISSGLSYITIYGPTSNPLSNTGSSNIIQVAKPCKYPTENHLYY